MGCRTHPLPQQHAPPARPSAALAKSLGCGLRHRVRSAVDGRARRAGRRRTGRPAARGPGAGPDAGFIRSEVGFLAGLRDVQLHVARLDDLHADLIADAELIAGDHGSALYEFVLTSEARRLLSGRATVVFNANQRVNL